MDIAPAPSPAPVRVLSLASGSSGNALIIDAGHTRLLLDAGIPARRIEQGLARLGLTAALLDGVLVSHEHVDHISGLPVLARRHRLPVHWTAGTARALGGTSSRVEQRVIRPGATIDIGRATVTPLPVSHDGAEPVGFVVEVSGVTIAVFTDLGCAEPHLEEPLRRADLIVLEANHDLDRLWSGGYPWPLKQRVASMRGHLCNDDSGDLLARAITDRRPRTVWLAHLSQANNEVALADAAVRSRIAGRAIDLHVLPRHSDGPLWASSSVVADGLVGV